MKKEIFYEDCSPVAAFLHKAWRAVLHAFVGMINAAFFFMDVTPALGVCFFVGFLIYEFDEDRWKKDAAFRDILGWLIGFAAFSLVMGLNIHVLKIFRLL